MSKKHRRSANRKNYIAVLLIALLIVALGVVFYVIANPLPRIITPGVKAGDTFTFTLRGTSSEPDIGAVNSLVQYDFLIFNQTETYKITIDEVNGTQVAFSTTWKFINGTEIKDQQKIDIATGNKTATEGKDDQIVFWAIYGSNFTKNERLRPYGGDRTTVNETETRYYQGIGREINIFSLQNQFTNIQDPTGSMQRFDSLWIYFDKIAGMLVDLRNIQIYTNPNVQLTITWKLIETNAWAI